MFKQKAQIFIFVSLIGIGILQAILGFYADNLALITIGVLLIVLNVAYVYVVAPRPEH